MSDLRVTADAGVLRLHLDREAKRNAVLSTAAQMAGLAKISALFTPALMPTS